MFDKDLRTYTYRRPMTAGGIKDIENDTLEPYGTEMYASFNTGVLEQYLDEKARKESFKIRQWAWSRTLIGIFIGVIFAIINQYVGLKVGIIVAGNWYLVYVVGMALRWKPNEVNIASGASTGASATCTGFVFTFPAIYLLAYHAAYIGKGGSRLINPEMIPSIATAYIAVLFCSIFGVLIFTVFRKIWLLDDPLPVPGFEATIKMLDIVNDISAGATKKAMKSLKIVGAWTGISILLTFLKDFPFMPAVSGAVYTANSNPNVKISIFDSLFAKSSWYFKGRITQPYEYDTTLHTHLDFAISPMMFAIGWFMKMRSAFLVAAGSLLTWFVIVPAAMLMNLSVYVPSADAYKPVMDAYFMHPFSGFTPAIAAYKDVAIPLAIGAILGGGITALVKMSKVFGSAYKDLTNLKSAERKDLIHGKGWFEWPYSHIPISAIPANTVNCAFDSAFHTDAVPLRHRSQGDGRDPNDPCFRHFFHNASCSCGSAAAAGNGRADNSRDGSSGNHPFRNDLLARRRHHRRLQGRALLRHQAILPDKGGTAWNDSGRCRRHRGGIHPVLWIG